MGMSEREDGRGGDERGREKFFEKVLFKRHIHLRPMIHAGCGKPKEGALPLAVAPWS